MDKKSLWKIQSEVLREPMEIVGADPLDAGFTHKSLRFKQDDGFLEVLEKNNLTLFTTREYEHLLLAYSVKNGKLQQSFFPIPHPSGIAIDSKNSRLYVASTRNPNYILEMAVPDSYMQRIENQTNIQDENVFMPSRTKYFGGATYFHDLVFIGNELFANSVGQNGIIKIDFNSPKTDEIVWQPKNQSNKNLLESNYLQLNSIAAGADLETSYFSASVSKAGEYRPGDIEFQVDKQGVIFSANTGEVFATGLTRPHSARMHKGKIWVCDSGYGTVGFIENGKYASQIQLPGWTRGLHFSGNLMFVGVSHVLERFRMYAPGIKSKNQLSGIFVFDATTLQALGKIEFPYGNQIFAIESLDKNISTGFLHQKQLQSTKRQISNYYKYKI